MWVYWCACLWLGKQKLPFSFPLLKRVSYPLCPLPFSIYTLPSESMNKFMLSPYNIQMHREQLWTISSFISSAKFLLISNKSESCGRNRAKLWHICLWTITRWCADFLINSCFVSSNPTSLGYKMISSTLFDASVYSPIGRCFYFSISNFFICFYCAYFAFPPFFPLSWLFRSNSWKYPQRNMLQTFSFLPFDYSFCVQYLSFFLFFV